LEKSRVFRLQSWHQLFPRVFAFVQALRRKSSSTVSIKAAIASGPCAVLILGGDHDLSASVKRLGGATVEWVTTSRYNEVAAR
jgi:hypothetical protein